MMRWLFAMSLLLIAQPAFARDEPRCLTLMGDYAGGEDPPSFDHEIDARAITSLDQLRPIVAARRAEGENPVLVRGLKLTAADFRGSDWSSICFFEADLSGSYWQGVTARNSGFINSNLAGADMRGAKMAGTAFRSVYLNNVKATGADWRDTHFSGGWFDGDWAGLDISGANMTGFVLSCSITIMDGCPVDQGGEPIVARGANFTRANGILGEVIDGAILDGTILDPSAIRTLGPADIRGPLLFEGGAENVTLTADEVRALIALPGNQSLAVADYDKPSFACDRALTPVERIICDPDQWQLKRLDREMAAAYSAARAKKSGEQGVAFGRAQSRWNASRSACLRSTGSITPPRCLEALYEARIDAINEALADVDFLVRGESAYFIDDSSFISPANINHPAVQKLLPAIIGESYTEIIITRDAAGRYEAVGSAIAANAHSCSLGIKDAQLGKGGWFGAAADNSQPFAPVFRHNDGVVTVFQSGKSDYEKYPRASDFASCGARASFGAMRRVPLDPARIQEVRDNIAVTGL